MVGAAAQVAIITGLLYGTVTDLKRREVPDWLNFSLIGAGLGLALLDAASAATFKPLFASAIGLLLGILIGYAMFYAGQWGGGDAKLIMGLGALMGLWWQPFTLKHLPLFITFLVNTVLVGATYGLAWMLVMIAKKRRAFKKAFHEFMGQEGMTAKRVVIIATTAALIILAFIVQQPVMRIVLVLLAIAVFFLFYLWVLSKVVEQACMTTTRATKLLTEGDWVIQPIWADRRRASFMQTMRQRHEQELAATCRDDSLLSLWRQLGCKKAATKRQERLRSKTVKNEAALEKDVLERLEKRAKLPLKVKQQLIAALHDPAKLAGAQKTLKQAGLDLSYEEWLKETYKYDQEREYIAGPGELGLTNEQLDRLKMLGIKQVIIKEGVPFVPSFLIAYVLTIIAGNWLAAIL